VLCGGYSVRLWPLTIDISKVLLPIAGKPVLKYALDFLQESSAIGKTILSVNQKFAPQIQKYADHYQSQVQLSHPIEMVVEPSTQQKEKLGPVGALQYITSRSTPRDLLVLGGDNIFGFRLDEFLHFIPKTGETCSYNAVYEYQDQTLNSTEYGTVDLDQAGNFLTFTEKPKQTSYKNISTACYFFKERDIVAIHEYIEAGENPDSLGGFIHWLVNQRRIASFVFSTFWFDIGTRETLLQANEHFLSQSSTNVNRMPKTDCIEPVCIEANAKVSDSKLGPNVYIGSEVRVTNSTIRNSIIMERSVITGSDINNSVIGSGSVIEGQIIEAVCGPNSRFTK
jgi:glucose-1-phosphate thymidylyltransferase